MNGLQKLVLLLGVVCAAHACGDIVCGSQQYVPNPDDCNTFYECNNGIAVLISCPPGLEFSVSKGLCDYPAEAQCVPSNRRVREQDSSANLPNYYCPEVDGPSAYIYPNPLSCTSYYMCAGGSLQFHECRAGLEYDIEERGCDFPERAKCNLANLPTFPTGPTPAASVAPTTATPAYDGPTPGYYCPEVDGDTAYIYPNPLSCSSYFMCVDGSLQYYNCQPGLEYDIEERGCDYPERAKCNLANLPTFPTGPTPAASVAPTTVTPAYDGPTPGYYCPQVDGPIAYIYPNPLSCSSYFMCVGGSLRYYQCRAGLEYDIEERGCDFPERAKCNLANLPTFPTGPTIPATIAPTTATPAYDGPTPGYYCPEVDGDTAYIYPNPLSCSSYFMCAGGSLHYHKCQAGLEYDVEERGCDYPERAKCNLANLPSYPTGPTAAPAVTSTAAAPANVVCPANVETLVRDPTDCSKFYSCNYGTPIRENCNPGLYFSQSEQGCDYPANVAECKST